MIWTTWEVGRNQEIGECRLWCPRELRAPQIRTQHHVARTVLPTGPPMGGAVYRGSGAFEAEWLATQQSGCRTGHRPPSESTQTGTAGPPVLPIKITHEPLSIQGPQRNPPLREVTPPSLIFRIGTVLISKTWKSRSEAGCASGSKTA